MFSGIVQEIGIVEDVNQQDGLKEITISSKLKFNLGESVSVNGCCLTVTDSGGNLEFKVQITNETLSKTNFLTLHVGSKVNLEPSLRLGDKLDGHLVSGHVDDVGEVKEISTDSFGKLITIHFPERLSQFIAPKGSIAVNGVSLTVIDVKNNTFNFTLIPYTEVSTNLGLLKIGDLVNLEVDLVSKYLVNYLEKSRELIKK